LGFNCTRMTPGLPLGWPNFEFVSRGGSTMGNHLKGCGCRSGMHTKSGGKLLQKIVRSIRRSAKQALRRDEEPVLCRSRGYTD
jgi:hypothetical protein